MTIKHFIKTITSPQQRTEIKRWKRHIKAFFKGGKKTTLEELRDVLVDDLGIKASDILQSNGIIWVEGPSDRIYINKFRTYLHKNIYTQRKRQNKNKKV